MASSQLLVHTTEVSCDSSGDGAVSIRINGNKTHKRQLLQQHSTGTLNASGGGGAAVSKNCKYSISSSCSSGESVVRRMVVRGHHTKQKMPQLFERFNGQFWDPGFDSSILEVACQERCFPQTRRRFRYVLFYSGFSSLLWGVHFGVNSTRCDPQTFLIPTAAFLLVCLFLFLFTFTKHYAYLYSQTSLLLIAGAFAITLAPQMQTAGFLNVTKWPLDTGHGRLAENLNMSQESTQSSWVPCISPVGTFSLCMEVLLLLYSMLHQRLYACVFLGLVYSIVFEALGWVYLTQEDGSTPLDVLDLNMATLHWLAPAKALLHLCAHGIGVHLFVMSEVRARSTFLKVGQAIMHGKDLEVEKALKERMIHSVMPRRVADELMKQGDEESENSIKRYSSGVSAAISASPKGNKRKKTSIPRGQIIFRPFNMRRMEPVSILFADIVGFTRMSANKSAHALVGLLNDLFGRFDHLCEITCCEKISTLGDCYYCVAGCPEPQEDHAYCCIEMGLGMIQAIEQFCRETQEMVNMRVGVHTGTVLCGILGMKRFKFDVWSNDVNLANLMEQLGVAGKVHISEATIKFLDDRYQCEDGRVTDRVGHSVVTDQLKGLKTYLISGRKASFSRCSCSQLGLESLESVAAGGSPSPSSPTLDGLSATLVTDTLSPDACTRSEHSCVTCSMVPIAGEDPVQKADAVQNKCQDEHKASREKVAPGQSPVALNRLLRPHLGQGLDNSRTSLCEMLHEKDKLRGGNRGDRRDGECVATMDHTALIPLRSKNFRERSDAHFVDVIKEDSLMKDYFFKPPINRVSLNFLEPSLESAYRTSYQQEVETQAAVRTFASPTFSSLLDVLLSCKVFLALTLACFLCPLFSGHTLPLTTLALVGVTTLLETISLVLSIRMTFCLDSMLGCTHSLLCTISGWIPRHMIGAMLVSLPALSIFSHITCQLYLSIQFTNFLCCAVVIAIIQYCNFCQLSFWMRSTLATMVGVGLLIVLYLPLCNTKSRSQMNISIVMDLPAEAVPQPQDLLGPEATLAFFLLLLLVWFLNRELEVSYRLHYHGNVEADQHRIKIQNMRDQADWLLRNIIPIHVAEQLKVTQSYSKNHDNIGVIFASIVNFSEFYEESYEGGKECYRVLNELIGDFDELLCKPPFSTIEKIKTIGATYMAASGLSNQQGDDQNSLGHLCALFDFALEMMRVVDDFNKNMLGFKFKLRIGFNHGPLTAGVIGTTKLLYDIWGDTVNIASRMDSTGVECRVQVSEESYCILREVDYEFDYRGTVNVKGKGQMKTFLYPKSSDSGPVPQYKLSVSPEIRIQIDGSIGRSPTDEIPSMVPLAAADPVKAVGMLECGREAHSILISQVAALCAQGPEGMQVYAGPLPILGPSEQIDPSLSAPRVLKQEDKDDDEADELTEF